MPAVLPVSFSLVSSLSLLYWPSSFSAGPVLLPCLNLRFTLCWIPYLKWGTLIRILWMKTFLTVRPHTYINKNHLTLNSFDDTVCGELISAHIKIVALQARNPAWSHVILQNWTRTEKHNRQSGRGHTSTGNDGGLGTIIHGEKIMK